MSSVSPTLLTDWTTSRRSNSYLEAPSENERGVLSRDCPPGGCAKRSAAILALPPPEKERPPLAFLARRYHGLPVRT